MPCRYNLGMVIPGVWGCGQPWWRRAGIEKPKGIEAQMEHKIKGEVRKVHGPRVWKVSNAPLKNLGSK